MRTDFPRPLTHFVCTALLLVSALVAGSTAAWAQPTTTTPRAGWRVGGTTNAMARLGNVLYIGGQFRGVAPEANASGSTLLVEAVSGLPIPGFPGFGGLTGAIEPDGAGGWYLGGNFLDAVDGAVQARFRLAHVLANGDLDQAWTPTAEGGVVRALKLVPGVGLFVGGDFTSLSGDPRMRVGLDPVSGAVLPWTYNVNGGATPQVRTLAYDGGTLFIGGAFTTVDASARPASASRRGRRKARPTSRRFRSAGRRSRREACRPGSTSCASGP